MNRLERNVTVRTMLLTSVSALLLGCSGSFQSLDSASLDAEHSADMLVNKNQRGLARTTPTVPLSIEAENMATKNVGALEEGGSLWALVSDGAISQPVLFPASGRYVFAIRAKADLALGVGARLVVKIDGVRVGAVMVESVDLNDYVLEANVTVGIHRVALAFNNDYYDEAAGEDRNLFLDRLSVTLFGEAVPTPPNPVPTPTPQPTPTPVPPQGRLVSPAFFVSPNGNDANSGASPSSPFLTLERAQSAMRSSSTKTTYLMAGTFRRTKPLYLNSNDAGQAWLGYPGQTPIIDGGRTTAAGFDISGNNITIRWLTIQNYANQGINATSGSPNPLSNILIDSNTIQNIYCTGWNQGGIEFGGSLANITVTHNMIRDSQYSGIQVQNAEGDTRSSVKVLYNAVYNTCTAVADCGAIYLDDRNHSGSGTVIDHNIVGNYGPPSSESKAIYLDDMQSNTIVTNNIIYGTGSWAVQYHGGDHNIVQNNVFDISGANHLAYYQWLFV